MSSRELYEEINRVAKNALEEHRDKNKLSKNYLLDSLSAEAKKELKKISDKLEKN